QCHPMNEHDTSTTEVRDFDLMDLLRFIIGGGEENDFEAFETEKLAPPASKIVVENLKQRTVTELDPSEKCPVCLVPYSGTVIEMPCNHSFHKDCLHPWLNKTNSCPVCRFELLTDDPKYEEYKKEKEREKEREYRVEQLHNSMFG
uniref:E3 ubiquitin-protein ligase RNF181 n=2 Tax=Ciona intestinalis TaxID=7719 RepID=F6TGC0_CIOIN